MQKLTSKLQTNSSSIVSKRSVEKMYYPNEPHYFRYFVRKYQRRAPLINRGYWLRLRAIDVIVRRFLTKHQAKKRKLIINLGCGRCVGFGQILLANLPILTGTHFRGMIQWCAALAVTCTLCGSLWGRFVRGHWLSRIDAQKALCRARDATVARNFGERFRHQRFGWRSCHATKRTLLPNRMRPSRGWQARGTIGRAYSVMRMSCALRSGGVHHIYGYSVCWCFDPMGK